VIEICENVSFSKEKKGLLNQNLPKHVMLLRNIVSDADKLDAIGKNNKFIMLLES